ncbi:UNVERIFIED_CONTAM: putative pectate lyase 12 [Sesamum calycinum]|uniref:Pectate lyase 12 n=1 Tax=Sesamum calycinum TaxID=2727403 RepID=A0AAW2NWV9_9LAMI
MEMVSCSGIVFLLLVGSFSHLGWAMLNLTLPLPGQHPSPEAVAHEVHRQDNITCLLLLLVFCSSVSRKVNASISRREMLSYTTNDQSNCLTGNPIDDCWRCDPNWQLNRQRLADCAIGFGQYALVARVDATTL